MRHIVQVALGVGNVQIDGGRRDLIAQGQHRDSGLQAARAAQQMAGHGFGGADGELISVLAKDALERGGFNTVAHFGGGAVRIHIVDLFGFNAGVLNRQAHHAERSIAVYRRAGDVIGIAAHAITDDFGQDVRTAPPGMLELFEHQNARALAHHESIALDIPGTRGFLGFIIALRKRAHGGESADAHGSDASLRAAADHHVGIVALDDLERIANGMGAGGASRGGG